MPMPKGYKKETGYGSTKSLGGLSYHQIAKKMNEKNYKMNHLEDANLKGVGVSSLSIEAKGATVFNVMPMACA